MPSLAKVHNNSLILSLTAAEEPIVWKLDLAKAQEASFMLAKDQAHTDFYSLCVQQDGGEAKKIALFSSKLTATEALQAISYALGSAPQGLQQGAAGGIHSGQGVYAAQKSGKGWFIALGLAAFLVILLVIIGSFAPASMDDRGADGRQPLAAGTDTQQTGTPVPADLFLQQRP